MTYTTPPTAVASFPLTAADWNLKVRDSIEAVAKMPRCRVKRTASFPIPTGGASATAVSWTAEDFDSDNIWAIGLPTRLVVPVTGLYEVTFGAQFTANATGARLLGINKNGGIVLASYNSPGGAAWYSGGTITAKDILAAGDYIECVAYQTSGIALNLDIAYPIWAAMNLVAY